MTEFRTQVCRSENSYRLQFETVNREYYLFMQEAARACIDGKAIENSPLTTTKRNNDL